MKKHAFVAGALTILSGSIFAVNEHGDGKAEAGARDAANALKSVSTDAGLKLDIWAFEPMLANPVAFAPDERGRWYVSESYRQEGRQVNGKPIVGGVVDNRGHMGWLNDDIAARTTDDRLRMMRKYYPDASHSRKSIVFPTDRSALPARFAGMSLACGSKSKRGSE